MTQEEKQLLLKDLCARLPYHCQVFYEYVDDLDNKTYGYSLTLNTWCIDEFDADKAVVKPYLRPMDSITEEEEKEFNQIFELELEALEDVNNYGHTIKSAASSVFMIDFYNKHHFDYRGLIEKGLAIAVIKENNPYEN